MSNTAKIKIAPALCKEISSPYRGEALQIKMPKGSQYEGYEFTYGYYGESSTIYYEIYRPSNYKVKEFTLVKSTRKEGERHKRYRLKWAELATEFADHQKQFDKSMLPKALAYYNDYSYRGRVEVSRNSKYTVGGVEGNWFWENDENKRRISAKNFELICMLSEDEAKEVNAYIDELNSLEEEVYDLQRNGSLLDVLRQAEYRTREYAVLDLKRKELISFIEDGISELENRMEALKEKLDHYRGSSEGGNANE